MFFSIHYDIYIFSKIRSHGGRPDQGCDLCSLLVGSVNRAASGHISFLRLDWEFSAPGGSVCVVVIIQLSPPEVQSVLGLAG